MNPLRMQIAQAARSAGAERPVRGTGFNNYAAGDKRYGPSMRRGPNTGMALDRSGYRQRDQQTALRRQLVLQKMQAKQAGKYANPITQYPIGR